MEDEQWKPIEGFGYRYEVSSLGKVRSLLSGKLLKPGKHPHGYLIVGLSYRGKSTTKTVHNLVAEAFLGYSVGGLVVTFKDGNPANPAFTNLKYTTRSEISKKAYQSYVDKLKTVGEILNAKVLKCPLSQSEAHPEDPASSDSTSGT